MIAPTNVNENNGYWKARLRVTRYGGQFSPALPAKKCRLPHHRSRMYLQALLYFIYMKIEACGRSSRRLIFCRHVRGIKNAQNFLSRRWFQRLLGGETQRERGTAFVVGNYAEGRVLNLQVRWTADAPPAINAEPLIISLSPWAAVRAKNLSSCHTWRFRHQPTHSTQIYSNFQFCHNSWYA